ncbi:MAG: ATP-dependent dethiobiotin synthetase BioD [Bacteroidetes bacterium]|nr:ATP-dependent dethiobiotin synthetase BioD [Bacteroidota bacterium]
MQNNVFFITGIDTNIGKSYATGYLAKKWNEEGYKVITQKFIQTGNIDDSEDILVHRQIMGIGKTQEDIDKITAPIILTYPCSPHLAARIDNTKIDLIKIKKSTDLLLSKYDRVLIEGAGGLMVPITEDYFILDYILEYKYPLILVTSGKLGSLNHTLLNLKLIKNYNINLYLVVFNECFEEYDDIISKDSFNFIKNYLKTNFPNTEIIRMPKL